MAYTASGAPSRTPTGQPSRAARRVGYVIAATINVVLLYLINIRPGWQAVPILTDETRQILGVVNVSLVVGLTANAAYLINDAPWLKALGELVSAGIALIVLTRVWQVFPFDFADGAVDWPLLVRFVLTVAIVGTVIGLFVQLVGLARAVSRADR